MLQALTNFENQVLNAQGVVVVKMFATWCGPCKSLAPVMEKVSEFNAHVPMYELDVDSDKDLTKQLNITSIPVVLFYVNGKEVNRLVGLLPQSKYQETIDKLGVDNSTIS